jgi:ATP-dependent protease Clp ATPase subunit
MEFAVTDIKDIKWSFLSFKSLTISDEQRDVTIALAEAHIDQAQEFSFDDVIKGKGQGLIVLLQYYSSFLIELGHTDIETSGPPGLGKTLTAEAAAEHLMLPLYLVGVLSCIFP